MKILFLFFIIAMIVVPCQAQTNSVSKDTITTNSGLRYIVNEKGNGKKAAPGKEVEVNYTGYLINGKKFDSSYDRNQPIDFVLGEGKVIKGWDEGISLMQVGDKFRLIIPPDLAYGKSGAGNVIPPNSTLIFDTELMSVNDPKFPIADSILTTIFESGIDSAISKYHFLYQTRKDEYNFKEAQLNTLGYRLLKAHMGKEAIAVFELNAETYPESSNVYDSLGECYMLLGNNIDAINNYKKSLVLNPKNERAEEMLKKLKGN